MRNITIAMDEELIKAGREYATANNTTLNALLRTLLEKTVSPNRNVWIDECMVKLNKAGGNSDGREWSRDELYER